MGVLSEISRLPAAIHRLTASVQALTELQRQDGPSVERLDELERSRSLWEAGMEALVMRADAKLKASRNAEERARKMRNFDEDLFDDEPEDRTEAEIQRPGGGGFLPDVDVQASEEAGVHGVPVGVEDDGKAYAVRAKFGG